MKEKIKKLKDLLKESNGILSEQKEMSFSTVHKFYFDISKEIDLEKYVFEFDSIEEFSLVVSASCDNVTKENAKNVIEKLLSKNGKSLNDKFCLTLTTT